MMPRHRENMIKADDLILHQISQLYFTVKAGGWCLKYQLLHLFRWSTSFRLMRISQERLHLVGISPKNELQS